MLDATDEREQEHGCGRRLDERVVVVVARDDVSPAAARSLKRLYRVRLILIKLNKFLESFVGRGDSNFGHRQQGVRLTHQRPPVTCFEFVNKQVCGLASLWISKF